MTKLITTLYLFIIMGSLHTSHDFFVSITEIDHSATENTLQITVKLFTDDLEKALEAQGTEKLYLGTDKEAEKANQYIEKYLHQKLLLNVNDSLVDFNYLGKEFDLEATWCYAEVENIPKVHTLEVTNKIFLDSFEGQTNIVHTHIHNKKKSLLLSEGNITDKLVY